MASHVFFSFHYERDIHRAANVRNAWRFRSAESPADWWDHSLWETKKAQGPEAVKQLINNALQGTSATVVLIGSETASRRWVQYEILQSVSRRNALLGVYIHDIKNLQGYTDFKGPNPFDQYAITPSGKRIHLASVVSTYDWVVHDGYENLGKWIDSAKLTKALWY